MDRERIKELVEELEGLVSNDKAGALQAQYGGHPVGSNDTTTEQGYLKFGLTMIKSALVSFETGGKPDPANVASGPTAGNRSRAEESWSDPAHRLDRDKGYPAMAGFEFFCVVGVVMFLSIMMLVGIVTTLRWFFW
ncbi:hypothetical protein [Pelagibius sp. Alg239-R121]|uniref:hypothetical protein n=1 Tax=Pelagibius sp. Alg239-R121 TaxID=2993448 RepID=UPI0024A74C78|nr:hypothetical protein [Pelagibius sp. Alg239-R121]